MSAYRHLPTRTPNSQQKPGVQQTGNSQIFLRCSFFRDLTGLFLLLLNTISHARYTQVLSASPGLAKNTRPNHYEKRAEESGEWRELRRKQKGFAVFPPNWSSFY